MLLFARLEPLGVAWLRIASAALIFVAWRRPWKTWRALDRHTLGLIVAWAAVLAVMNSCFYLAIDRLPLGTVAAIEFLPVIAVAALGTRTGRNVVALVLAAAGVYLLSDVRLIAEPLGFAFAGANALLFALYIVPDPRAGSPGQNGCPWQDRGMHVPTVTVADVPADAPLLDVREADEWTAGHAPTAQHLPMSELVARIDELPDDDPLYIVCRSGGRSARVVAYLANQGYPAVNVDGGMQAWSAQGRAIVADAGPPQIV